MPNPAPRSCAKTDDALLVDVFVQQRTARVERPLTYALPPGVALGIGAVVRVPLGPKELYGFVVSDARRGAPPPGTRVATPAPGIPPAFDRAGLALARFIAERYCCSLGDALGTIVYTAGLPRVVDRFVVRAPLAPEAFPNVPPRLLRLVENDLAGGFALEALLRHPEARRAGDRRTLLGAIATLARAGALERTRTFVAPKMTEAREEVYEATELAVPGRRLRALVALARERGTLRRRDALLGGFSAALVARGVKTGALRARSLARDRTRTAVPRASEPGALVATAEQRGAIDAIEARVAANAFAEILVHGITGSGKTFVYIEAIASVVAGGGRAIVLVPEIALTPQTARRFEAAFGERVAVLHSGLSERERFESWEAARRGEIDVVVGARSAAFAPLPDLRLIVVDEAHERSYKQENAPRYDAVAVARERMRLAAGVLVLGSATPPLETYAAARAGAIGYVRLEHRATALPLPHVTVVDLAAEYEGGNRRTFSSRLVAALAARLERGEKSVLFVNRRGSASFLLCRKCGAVPECARCSVSLVAHRSEGLLRCHLCDAQRPLPTVCPACGEGPIRGFGVGTQAVADAALALFPQARIVRMDSDTTTRIGDHARLLDAFAESGDILVGTQMVAKGLDFGAVTLVGVVAADIGLHAPDFRAAERTFDLLTQVAGRSGRALPGEAIVQTYDPDNPAIRFAAEHDYDGFAAHELAERAELGYPPYAELVYLGVLGADRAAVAAAAERYAALLRELPGVDVLGPAPYPVARANDEWRFRIALKCADGKRLRTYLREALRDLASRDREVRLAINVDP